MPLIVLIGPSGAGKSTLVDMFLERHPEASLQKSVTTRPPRGDHDASHVFVSDEAFDSAMGRGELMPAAEVYGYRYALPFPPHHPEEGLFIMIRRQFVGPFRGLYPEAHVIQIEAPADVLAERLAARRHKDREDTAALAKEIEEGRAVADVVVDTNQPLEAAYAAFEHACQSQLL